jgi:hypothetical protein
MASTFEMRRNISAMTKELVLLLLISGSLCAAQSTLATPGTDVRQNTEDFPLPNMGSNQQQGNGQQGNSQRGGIPDPTEL